MCTRQDSFSPKQCKSQGDIKIVFLQSRAPSLSHFVRSGRLRILNYNLHKNSQLLLAIFCCCAPARIRTQNNCSEDSRDIHFTTGAFSPSVYYDTRHEKGTVSQYVT